MSGSILEDIGLRLICEAERALLKSYSPYSKFRVGSALISDKGIIYLGTNVENSSYGLTICAERSACCNAIIGGESLFKAIAVVSE